MRALTIVGRQLVLAERPDPVAGTREVLVRVQAAGINGADALQVAGHYPAPAGVPPDIPGLELAGTVVATGPGVLRFAPGDRVMAVVGGGAQAELAVLDERAAMPVPAGLPWPDAGGFPEVFTTAHDALFTQARLTLGERVLVHGGAGGVGMAAVQLAAAAGAEVVATVRDPAHQADVARLGARQVVGDAAQAPGPFDVILELIGAPNFPRNVELLAPRGRISVLGVKSGSTIELDLRALMAKRGCILASTLRARAAEDKADAARRVESQVLGRLADGRIRVPIEARYPLDDAPSAYAHFGRHGKFGKVVLTMD